MMYERILGIGVIDMVGSHISLIESDVSVR